MKNILILGANSNVGSFCVKKWFHHHNLILHYNKSKNRIEDFISENNAFQCDLTAIEETRNAFQSFFSKTKMAIDGVIIFSSLRSSDFASLEDSEPEFWKHVLLGNVFSVYNAIHFALPHFSQQGGNIVCLGSNVSRIGLPQGSAYAASKAAIANMCRTLPAEISKRNIRINAISPGPIEIDTSHFTAEYQRFRKKYYDEKKAEIPLNKFLKMDEIEAILSFYLFKNTYISGEEIFVTGGKL